VTDLLATDLESRLRPIAVEEWRQLTDAFRDVFAEDPSGPFRDRPSPIARYTGPDPAAGKS
jgi:hypothetical protein